jgi:hypothetical protein
MSTSHPRFTARIEGSPETILGLIADMPNYDRWLPGSQAFGGDDASIAISGPRRYNLSRCGTDRLEARLRHRV